MAFIQGKNPNGETLDQYDGVTNYADTIIGNAGKDTIYGLGGDDVIKGGGGADYINGGSGFDMASYEDSAAGVTVNLQAGAGQGGTAEGDTLVDIEGVTGSGYADTLIGSTADNTLVGGGGADILKGGGGADTLDGGAGDDNVVVDSQTDTAIGGDGIDTLVLQGPLGMTVSLTTGVLRDGDNGYHGYPQHYGPKMVSGFENVSGSTQNDAIYGSAAANVLSGDGGSDYIAGYDGDDTIDGGAGDDTIVGGAGVDKLTGGAGFDTFRFVAFTDSTIADGKPQELISDFQQGVDRIDLSVLEFELADLLVLDGKKMDGLNVSYVGVDADHNGKFDAGEFAVAVKMDPGAHLTSADLIL